MANKKSPDSCSSRESNWHKIFNNVGKMLHYLRKERHDLEKKINYLNQLILQMKMEKTLDSEKTNLLLGLKERDALIYKKRLESTSDELGDFVEWFSYLSKKCSGEPQDSAVDASDKARSTRSSSLRDEVRKLNNELERIKIDKKSEVTKLMDEKKFVWNQYSNMENDFKEKLRRKSSEVELANEKITVLSNRTEELQSSNERLRNDLAKMESDSSQKSSEIARLMKEVELLKARSESETPVLRPCRKAPGESQKEGSTSTTTSALEKWNMQRVASKPVAHKSTGGKAPRKQLDSIETRSSKRKTANVVTIPDDTPKLFTSSFKVPKLKPTSPSPQVT